MPTHVLFDTSFVVRALVRSEPKHAICKTFLSQLAEIRARVVFNRLLELELAQALFRAGLRELHPDRGSGDKAWSDGRCRRRAKARMSAALSAWAEAREALDWIRIEVDEVADDIPKLMSSFGIQSYDACHVATAQYIGADWIVTLDPDFARVPVREARLLIDTASLRQFRRVRGGRQRR